MYRNSIVGFVILTLFISSSLFSQADKTAILLNGDLRELPIVHLEQDNNFAFVELNQLSQILQLNPPVHSKPTRNSTLKVGNLDVKVTALNPFIMINNKIVQMPVNSAYEGGELYIPVPFFIDIIAAYYPGKLESAYARKLASTELEIPESASVIEEPPIEEPKPVFPSDTEHTDTVIGNEHAPEITDISIEEKANGTLIRIKTTDVIDDAHINSRSSRGWLYIDLYGGKINPENVKTTTSSKLVSDVVPLQLPQMAQLSFKLTGDLDSRKVFSNYNTREILVSLTTNEQISSDLIKSLEDERKKWLIDTIIIDPGHGGKDPGAIGRTGAYEKDITLAIARHLKSMLEARSNIRVIMTRQDDRFVSLKERTHLANKQQGKLFISIHANSNRSRNVNGLTTYLLGQARTAEAIESARRENAVIRYEADSTSYSDYNTANYILASLAQNSFQQESEELAAFIQSEVTDRVSIKNRGVKQAGYYVLMGASMPNVLVETAFLSNPNEEKLLQTYQFQKKVAEGICDSILKFKEKYERGI